MANLILLKGKQKPIHMREIKVRPEEEIEKIIFEKEILPDVFLLKRQLQTSTNKERIDIVGIDNENNILVIEIKDETVDENVITQVTKYVEWVKTNPDAIKNIYLELKDKDKNKTKDLIFDWEKNLV
jgi:RecB family endonuclease NucS